MQAVMERYECLGVVGEGSYGSVLKCRRRDSGRLVAIKKFLDSDDDKAVKKIAMREIRLLKRLRHDNLVNLLEVWKRRRRWHLVFEFVERTVLEDLEQNPSGLELDTSRQYLFQILRAAAFCHQHNIIHRDIKPENILVSQGGVVKLCDFGFARTMATPGEGGAYTDYVATRWYRAPELLVGDTKYGKPVDVWAVGCLLVEMLTGQPLFPGDSDLDQLYHIVRCFGNLTAHHQELFYRNPVFSGVRLPECSVRVPLEQRYPALTHTALDLAQRCLQMDPESRAQCSDLLQHPLFTHDSFHIRFMDELNAKIQQDQRENSTLPKITKATRREREEEEERTQRGKDKKQPEEMEKTSKVKEKREREEREERTAKSKDKQTSKLSKTIRNTSAPPTAAKQSKTLDAKFVDSAATTTAKSKPGKANGTELRKELEISAKSSESSATGTATSLMDDNTMTTKPKLGKPATTEPRKEHLKTKEHMKESNTDVLIMTGNRSITVKSKLWRTSNSEQSQEFGKDTNHTETNVPKVSRNSTTYHPDMSLTPKASRKSTVDRMDTNTMLKITKMSTAGYAEGSSIPRTDKMSNNDHLDINSTLKASKTSSNDHTEVFKMATPTTAVLAKPCGTTSTSDRWTAEPEQRRDPESQKTLSSNPKPSKTTLTSGAKMAKNTSSSTNPSRTLTSDLSEESSTVNLEISTVNSSFNAGKMYITSSGCTTLTKTTSKSVLSKITSNSDAKLTNDTMCVPSKPSKGLPTDSEQIEGSTVTKDQQNASGKEYRKEPGSENSCADKQTTFNFKTAAETRTTSTSETHEIPKTNHPDISIAAIILKPSKASDKENRKDFAPSESSTVTKTLLNPTLTVSRSSIVEQKSSREADPDVKTTTVESSSLSDKMKPGSFSNHGKSTAAVTLRTPKTTFHTEAKMENGNIDRNETPNVSAVANLIAVVSQMTTPDDKASKCSVSDADKFGIDENAVKTKQSFTATLPKHDPPPPPPPPPSSPPIPPPPSSTPLLFPPPSTPLIPSLSIIGNGNSPGAGLHPGTHSLRCIDRPRQHGGVHSRLAQQSLSSQVLSEKSVIHEHSFLSDRGNLGNCGGVCVAKRKSDVRFPDLRSSMLPELRGRDGKHSRGLTKEQRKDKQPIPSIPSTEPQQHGHNSTDTHTL